MLFLHTQQIIQKQTDKRYDDEEEDEDDEDEGTDLDTDDE